MECFIPVTAGSKVLTRTSWRLRGVYALLLGSVVLVSMATASSPVAGGPLFTPGNVTHSSVGEAPERTESPAALPGAVSEAPGPHAAAPTTALAASAAPLRPAAGNHGNGRAGTTLAPRRDSGSPPSTDPRSPSEPAGWPRGSQSTPVRHTRDLTQATPSSVPNQPMGSHSAPPGVPQGPSPSSVVPATPPDPRVPLRHSETSDTSLHTPLSRSITSVTAATHFSAPESHWRILEGSVTPVAPGSQSDIPGMRAGSGVTSAPQGHAHPPAHSVGGPEDVQGDQASTEPDRSVPQNASGSSQAAGDWGPVNTTADPVVPDAAQGIHLLLKPPEMPAPSLVPFLRPHTTWTPPELTRAPPEELYPTHTAEADWGSGDYLETLSFMGSEGDDFSLVTTLPSEVYEWEDASTEVYDTSFPTRAVPPLSSTHLSPSPTLTPAHPTSARPGRPTLETPVTRGDPADEGADPEWADTYAIEPTEILLPDMNSLEYYTTLLAKENASSAGPRGNSTSSRLPPTPVTPTGTLTPPLGHTLTTAANASWPEEASAGTSGAEPSNATEGDSVDGVRPHLVDVSGHTLEPSVTPAPSMVLSTSLWGGQVSTPLPGATSSSTPAAPRPTISQRPSDTRSPDGQWLISSVSTETVIHPTASPTPYATPALTTPSPTAASSSRPATGKEGTTSEFPVTRPPRTRLTTPASTATPSAVSPGQSGTTGAPPVTTARPPASTPARHYLCNITRPDLYQVKVGLPTGSTTGYAKSHIREILKSEFNRSVDLQILRPPPELVFRAVSGPLVYTAMAVINALRQSPRTSSAIQSIAPITPVPDPQFHVHSVLQFVPGHIDVRVCNFSERIEKGLTMAYAEVRRRSHESTNFTVQIVNITMNAPKAQRQQRAPVDITFAVRDANGYLRGSDVSGHLRLLNMVEFSFYLGFPVLQIAEPFHYPELNVTHLLRSSWVRTVLLGVLDQRVNERTFQAKMERRLALLLGEVLGTARRWRRATSVGNNSVQIVRTSRLEGSDYPLEMVYFVEGPSGERVPAVTTSSMLNSIDVQRAAIILGYRVQGTLAQPVEKMAAPPSETQSSNMWIIVGVVVPVLVVVLIIVILYWKLCRTDKLEFQPDAVSAVQQRQKLQAPSVKGFDFAKLHLGQHSKDDIMVIQEPAPLPSVPVKEVTPSENGDVPTPKSKDSSTKASRAARRRGRISPSEGDSMVSDPSSGRESGEENLRPPVTPNEGKQPRKTPKNGKSKIGPPAANGADEQLSSASIFEHVDRMSRSGDGARRVPSKIQLIAMQPMPAPSPHSPAITERVPEGGGINKEIQVALRHKSEIEHHRNKIRLRAKRRGHYDFPAMDDIMDSFGDLKDPDRVYQKAQMQIDKILDPDGHMPSVFMDTRKSSSGRGKRSPKQRRRPQVNGSLTEADKDRLITTDSDGTYRKYPGVNNVAYVSDPDQPPEARSPSPNDDVFMGPGSPPPGPAPAPPPYVPPQPSIEEARQQMHSLLDDAFALVSPSSQGSTPGITLPGVTSSLPASSPPPRAPRSLGGGHWGSSYPAIPALSPFSARYAELGLSPPSVQSLLQRQGLGSGYLAPSDPVHGDQMQPDSLYSGRGLYSEELPSSARPRPVGGSTGAQLHHLTQVGLSSRIGAYQGMSRASSGQTGSPGWGPYRPDEEYSRAPVRDAMPRTALREPSAPPAHLDSPGMGYPSAPPEETSPPGHSSASLIKAIREELMRLSQKQAAVPVYHS
ncbi:UPF0606 protein KIAA1549-like [Megalops cyprinoides]|uniref:UPF0606 protein KIAA1549-like n=1 Tax=Megalops cyprinoides TaxID=118141 RepID=UPI001865021D|nr:UPF0606 protein KIAA1549-like [Megalops cyprinoides]